MMTVIKAAGIALELVQYVKAGRLSQYAEPLSEAGQLLEASGWKCKDERVLFMETRQTTS